MLNIKSKLMIVQWAMIASLLVALFVYKEWGEAQSNRADDMSTFLKEERELRFRDSKGVEHLRKEVESLNSGKSLKSDPEWRSLLKDVKDIKSGRIIGIGKTSTLSEYRINTFVRDTIVNDTIKTRCIESFKNEWISLSGCDGDFLVKTKDSLSYVIYKGKRTKKILFFRVGPRSVESEIVNYNPNTTIKYDRRAVIKNKE
jgi:hypothetical protein